MSRNTNTMSKMSNKIGSSKTSSHLMSNTHNLFCKRSKGNQLEAIKVSELIELLQKCDPDAEVWLPNVNELGIPGYCVLDHVMTMTFGEVGDDVMNNPGEIDQRLLSTKPTMHQSSILARLLNLTKKGLINPLKIVNFVPTKKQTREGSDKWIFESR